MHRMDRILGICRILWRLVEFGDVLWRGVSGWRESAGAGERESGKIFLDTRFRGYDGLVVRQSTPLEDLLWLWESRLCLGISREKGNVSKLGES